MIYMAIFCAGEVGRVQAYDADIGKNARLTYNLAGAQDLQNFQMDQDLNTNQGILNIFKVRYSIVKHVTNNLIE